MPLLVGCFALAFPRVAIFFIWLLDGGYLMRALEHWLWAVLGFIFLPLTTLAFAYAMNSMGSPGQVPPLGWVIIAVAGLVDLGLVRGGARRSSADRESTS